MVKDGIHSFFFIVLTGLCLMISTGQAVGRPGYGSPLDLTTGVVHNVSDTEQLNSTLSAVNNAGQPATILLADGTYTLDIPMLHIMCEGLVIRSASGDRDRVILRGPDEGAAASLYNVFLVSSNNVTIADLTFGWCRWHGIQVQGESPHDVSGLRVHNCRIVNCNEQFIKGSSSDGDPVGATDGIVENCLFEFTAGWAYQYYTGGIDIHRGVNWLVRDNLFRNIRSPAGAGSAAEHAVHFWKRCTTQAQHLTVERNRIINCDRGIGFGLTTYDGGTEGGGSIIRNNMIYNDGAGPFTDTGIGLEYACDVQVDNNTVYIDAYWAPIEYRFSGSSNIVFRNNLVNREIRARDGAPAGAQSNNVEALNAGWFADSASGDLHINQGVSQVIDQGCTITGFSGDIDGDSRPQGPAWDVGADEVVLPPTDTDGDHMPDEWEVRYGLNPDNPADAEFDPDGDRFTNLEEYIADTMPTNRESFLHVSITVQDPNLVFSVISSTGRFYSLQRSAGLVMSSWTNIIGHTEIPGPLDGTLEFTQPKDNGTNTFYRVQVSAH